MTERTEIKKWDSLSGFDWRKGVVGALGIGIVGIGICCFPFLSIPASKRLGNIPWMATPNHIIATAILQLPKGEGRRFVDLGSGDGRLVIAAAKNGYFAIGYELNYVLIMLSYLNAIRSGVIGKVQFRRSDFWKSELSGVDVVSCFGVNSVMDRLQDKVTSSAKKPMSVVLFRFPFKGEVAKQYLRYAKSELFIYKFD